MRGSHARILFFSNENLPAQARARYDTFSALPENGPAPILSDLPLLSPPRREVTPR